jgi:hypothetical protein
MDSILLSSLKRCFSIDFANNLIEKSPTSAAAAIIDPTIAFLIGEDHPRLPKNGGAKKVGIKNNIIMGGYEEVSYSVDTSFALNTYP